MKRYLLVIIFAIAAISCKKAESCDKTVVTSNPVKGTDSNDRTDNMTKEDIENAARIDSVWQKLSGQAKEIIALYDSIRLATPEYKRELHILNQCNYVWQCGEYMFKCRGKNIDIYELPKHRFDLPLDNGIVTGFASKKKIGKFVDHYFTLLAMQQGHAFNEARDGVTATVFYPIRALNENDFDKLRAIFSCKNDAIHKEYLERLKFPLNNSGCSAGLKSIQPLIEQNVAECRLKQEVLELYKAASRIMQGEPAPISTLKDTEGKEHTFAEFKGKVIVIDVWANWCSSCIINMPKFIALRNEYRHRDDICFITVSIDRSEDKEMWLRAIEVNNMQQMLNLFPDCEVQSQFETDFLISGVPRYIIIDKNGCIVSAHAPGAGPEMAEMIEKVL